MLTLRLSTLSMNYIITLMKISHPILKKKMLIISKSRKTISMKKNTIITFAFLKQTIFLFVFFFALLKITEIFKIFELQKTNTL